MSNSHICSLLLLCSPLLFPLLFLLLRQRFLLLFCLLLQCYFLCAADVDSLAAGVRGIGSLLLVFQQLVIRFKGTKVGHLQVDVRNRLIVLFWNVGLEIWEGMDWSVGGYDGIWSDHHEFQDVLLVHPTDKCVLSLNIHIYLLPHQLLHSQLFLLLLIEPSSSTSLSCHCLLLWLFLELTLSTFLWFLVLRCLDLLLLFFWNLFLAFLVLCCSNLAL